jgi:DNA-directed RNA polymerase specialized sigma24 family protein
MCRTNTFQKTLNTDAANAENAMTHTRAHRLGISVPPEALAALPESAGAWHESPDEVDRALVWGERKATLMTWVRETMRRRLSDTERRCIEMIFFEGLSCREAAARTGTSPSSTHRGLQRALEKLRDAAETDPEMALLGRKRRR